MTFLGLSHCVVQTGPSDSGEEHKFLVQENTNFDVVLGTTVLVASRKWRERTKEVLDLLGDKVGPHATSGLSSSVFSMRMQVCKEDWSDVTVARSCYVGSGSHRRVQLHCGLKETKSFL